MPDKKDHNKEIDALLKAALNPEKTPSVHPLKERFELRLNALNITRQQALNILMLEHRSLDAILNGNFKKIEFLNILKLAQFLDIPIQEFVNNYFQFVSETHSHDLKESRKRSFIANNFDLSALKKAGIIDNITDFDHIEKKLLSFFGYDSIYEYGRNKINPAFSSSKTPSHEANLNFWLETAAQQLYRTPNTYSYDRKALLEYFPSIRWYSMNAETGLSMVARALFKLGVTLLYIPRLLPNLHIRGATLAINEKPCIVLTNYRNYYPTLWFALIHELYHVLFDWEEIGTNKYHVSGEVDLIKTKEEDANHFARQYLFSDEKMDIARPHINDPYFISNFAKQNHVHPSLIYIFYAYENAESNKSIYGKYSKYMPDIHQSLAAFEPELWQQPEPIKNVSRSLITGIFNHSI